MMNLGTKNWKSKLEPANFTLLILKLHYVIVTPVSLCTVSQHFIVKSTLVTSRMIRYPEYEMELFALHNALDVAEEKNRNELHICSFAKVVQLFAYGT